MLDVSPALAALCAGGAFLFGGLLGLALGYMLAAIDTFIVTSLPWRLPGGRKTTRSK